VKDFYNENYKTLKKRIEEDSRSWKAIHDHGSAELIPLQWLYYQK
jgi:hypothetical protein